MRRFIVFASVMLVCTVLCCGCAYADNVKVECRSWEKANAFHFNWLGTATDWLFRGARSDGEAQRKADMAAILEQAGAENEDIVDFRTVYDTRFILTQFMLKESELVDMYVHPEQYERLWLCCSIESDEPLCLLGAQSETEGLWVDRGCGQEITYYDFGSEELYDGRIEPGEEKKVYFIAIVKKEFFESGEFRPKISVSLQSRADGAVREYPVDFSAARQRTFDEERFEISAVIVEDSDFSVLLQQKIIRYGIPSPEKQEYLLAHLPEYSCKLLRVVFDTDSEYPWWNADLEIFCPDEDVFFATEFYGESAWFSDDEEAYVYFFCKKDRQEKIPCEIWLLTETDKYNGLTSSFGYTFGPQQRFPLGEILLMP